MTKSIEFSIEQGDIITFNADVAALMYARNFYGPALSVAIAINQAKVYNMDIIPKIGDSVYIYTRNRIAAPHVIFVGVPELLLLGYSDICKFAQTALTVLADKVPGTKHLAMTINGPGFGLDEIEALSSQFTGFLQIIKAGKAPPALERISIVEKDEGRFKRLRLGFERKIAEMNNISRVQDRWAYRIDVPTPAEYKRFPFFKADTAAHTVGIEPVEKPHVFVAMPFRKEMEDIFYYGIQRATHANDLLCERIDQEPFTGDILDRVKKKIDTAAVVIAELSGANPNVYLEVGYAWGKKVPTILLIREGEELHFDIRGQRCLKYEIIKELEESLTKELGGLLSK